MNKRRLLKLADLLEADAKKKNGIKFDLGWFVYPADAADPKLDCSTQACAVGLACLSGEFEKDGLGWTHGSNGKELIPTFKGRRGSDAGEEFFQLSGCEFDFMFMPGGYSVGDRGAKAERAVAKRIRDFVAGRAAPDGQQ